MDLVSQGQPKNNLKTYLITWEQQQEKDSWIDSARDRKLKEKKKTHGKQKIQNRVKKSILASVITVQMS